MRGTAGTADSVPHNMHTTGPRLSEVGHALELMLFRVLGFPAVRDKTRIVFPGLSHGTNGPERALQGVEHQIQTQKREMEG